MSKSVHYLQGGKEYLMRAHFGLPSVIAENVEGRPPIHVRFEIPYFTVSGIQVNFVFYDIPDINLTPHKLRVCISY